MGRDNTTWQSFLGEGGWGGCKVAFVACILLSSQQNGIQNRREIVMKIAGSLLR